MKLRDIAIALVASTGAAEAQGTPARPPVTVSLTAQTATAGDSSGAIAALRRGLQSDSLVEFVDLPLTKVSPGRRAKFMVAAILRRTDDVIALSTRTFDVETSSIVARMSATATAQAFGDSAAAVGRRIAQTLAGNRP